MDFYLFLSIISCTKSEIIFDALAVVPCRNHIYTVGHKNIFNVHGFLSSLVPFIGLGPC